MTEHGSRLDPWRGSYAQRTAGMTASEIRALFSVASRPEVVSLAGGMPYLSALPMDTVAETVQQMLSTQGVTALQYGSGQGDPRLREQILEVMALEGIQAHADDIIVTTGSQQALDLVTRIFIDPGDVILAEAPSYVGALGVFAAYQAQVAHVTSDDDGLVPAALEERIVALQAAGRRIKFLYTVPTFSNPAGTTLSMQRRPQILDICSRHGILVLEDNPYGLLGFDVEPYPAMRSLVRGRRGLPRVLLQDVRAGAAGGLGRRPPRRAREAGARLRVGDPVPERLLPDDRLQLPGRVRLARADQGLPRALPRAARRDDRVAGQPAAGGVLDPPRWRLLRLGHPARGGQRQGHAAARDHRAGGLRAGHRLLRRRHRAPATPGSPTAIPTPTGSGRASAASPVSCAPSSS